MIKTLVFDFGDVFLTLDKSATQLEMQKLGINTLSDEKIDFLQTYEKGLVSTPDFLKKLQSWLPNSLETQLINAWNAVLIDFPQSRMDFIKQLSKSGKFQLILLSNTNDLHIQWISKNIYFFNEFKACFDAFYLSHEIHFRKPDANIFEFILKQHQLNPSETLFIDDTKENTEAAEKLGFHTWNINPKKEHVTNLFSIKSSLF